jgi:putative hydrolases of HD superfamily
MTADQPARVDQQIAFLVEVDRLKQVLRQTELVGGSRRENSAEHSWHVALMALVLAEHAGAQLDSRRVLAMLLVHDVVEVDAGDTFAFDPQANLTKAAREEAAAERIYGLLPADQGAELRALWDEFESGDTPESRLANALDRLAGLLSNSRNQGGTWRRHGVSREAVLRRMDPIREGAPGLWPLVLRTVEEAVAAGHIAPERI